jgi:hypothetical protein
MAKFRCVCGYAIKTSGEIPHPFQWNLVSDEAFDADPASIDVDELYMAAVVAFRCPSSGHLWIYWDGMDGEPTVYAPQDVRGVSVET